MLAPDDRRVVIKLFVPGEDSQLVQNRASKLIERILQLDEDEITRLLDDVLARFAERHHDILAVFQHHYDLVSHRVPAELDLSPAARTLIGAYFSHEFAVEAAALCNPSMVQHPDQAELRTDLLEKYVLGENDRGALNHWNVAWLGQTDEQSHLKTMDMGLERRLGGLG